MLEFFNERIHTAKKEHMCDVCGWVINAGERYIRSSGKYDGYFYDVCQHLHCNAMAKEYCLKEGENEYDSDCVADYLNDHYCLNCERHIGNAPEDDAEYEKWDECDFSVFECPKLKSKFIKEDKNDGSEN